MDEKQKNNISIVGRTLTVTVPLDQQNPEIMALGMLQKAQLIIASHFDAQQRKALQSKIILDNVIKSTGGNHA